MREIMKWIGIVIIVISMVIALVYGTVEVIDLVKELAMPEASQSLSDQVDIETGSAEDSWKEHLKGISLAGLDLAVLSTAWFQGSEYFKNKLPDGSI